MNGRKGTSTYEVWKWGPSLRRSAKRAADPEGYGVETRARASVEVLDALLLDVRLLDLVRQPGGPVGGLGNHGDRAGEDVDTLRPALAQANARVPARCSLKGRTTRLLAREHLARILSVFHQHKVLLFSHEVFLHLFVVQDKL